MWRLNNMLMDKYASSRQTDRTKYRGRVSCKTT